MQTKKEEKNIMKLQKTDEDFAYFIEEFGAPEHFGEISNDVVLDYQNKLPVQLFKYWSILGESAFYNRLFWIVNPEKYQTTLDSWLEGTKFEDNQTLSVITRNCFGVLYIWEKGKGGTMKIDPHTNTIYYSTRLASLSLSPEEEEEKIRYYFGSRSIEGLELLNNNNQPLFEKILSKLGKVDIDTMYGYKFRLSLGGKREISNFEICNTEIYHDISQQMERPQVYSY